MRDSALPRSETASPLPRLDRSGRVPVPPLMVWGAMWLVAISVTVAATLTLLYPRKLAEPPQPAAEIATESPVSVPAAPPEAATPELGAIATDATVSSPTAAAAHSLERRDPTMPLRLLMVLTASCAVTSLVVTLLLRQTSQVVNRELPQPAPANPRLEARLQERRARTQTPPAPASRPPFAQPKLNSAATARPAVMVLPPEWVTPLDEPEVTGDLAAQMDIRRRYSLSNLIYAEGESRDR